MTRPFSLAAAAAALLIGASTAHASPVLANGSFSSNGGPGQLGFNTTADGWLTDGIINYIYTDSANARAGAIGHAGSDLTAVDALVTDSPNGGAFFSGDGDPVFAAPLFTTVTGLVAGTDYLVDFFWAGAQQAGFPGATTEQWQVSLGGGPAQFTPIVSIPQQGFSGWQSASLTFTADAASSLLQFLAIGTPGGGVAPPFVLLDGVSVRDVPALGPPTPDPFPPDPMTPIPAPEPGTLTLLGTGVFGLVRFARSRKSGNSRISS